MGVVISQLSEGRRLTHFLEGTTLSLSLHVKLFGGRRGAYFQGITCPFITRYDMVMA
jgi:hypothetical protein